MVSTSIEYYNSDLFNHVSKNWEVLAVENIPIIWVFPFDL